MEFPQFRQLASGSQRRVYKSSRSGVFDGAVDVVKGLHYGQRKLILSEIEFLTAVLRAETTTTKPVLVVYAGAANGSHLPLLFELFPQVKYVLIDPAPFCEAVRQISEEDGPIVEIIEGYCTDELCMRLKRDYSTSFRVVLVSDIRSGAPNRSTNKEHTEMIMRDNAWQEGWYVCLNAECAMLKFHPPYPKVMDPASPKYEPDDETPQVMTYLDGALLWGVWAPKSSSEVRLIVQGELKKRNYDAIEFEEQCYYYNTTNRFDRDVEAERAILTGYIALNHATCDAEALSSRLSAFLSFPRFLPLCQSEDEARIVSLLYLSKSKTDAEELFPALKAITFREMCAEVARRCGISADGSSFPTVPNWFWTRVANSKNLGEAYSFPPLPRQHQPEGHRRPQQPAKRLREEHKK
jgi:cap2 methyltransferase